MKTSMSIRLVLIGLIASCYFIAVAAWGATPAALLSAKLQVLNSMQANFTQHTKADGKITQQSTGKMAFLRPNRFYWQVHGLSEQLIVSDGRHIWIYDKDLAQVTQEDIKQMQQNAPGLLLSGSPEYITQHYAVQLQNTSHSQYTQVIFKLTPKDSQSLFQYALLTFKGQTPIKMQFVDNLDQITTILFQKVAINPKLDPNLFVFHPPKGVDVIQQRY